MILELPPLAPARTFLTQELQGLCRLSISIALCISFFIHPNEPTPPGIHKRSSISSERKFAFPTHQHSQVPECVIFFWFRNADGETTGRSYVLAYRTVSYMGGYGCVAHYKESLRLSNLQKFQK